MKWENGACATSIAKIRRAIYVVGFGFRFDVTEDTKVNGLDDVVGPELPVPFWPQAVSIPGGSLQAGGVAGERCECELTPFRSKETIEMSWLHLAVAEFAHGRRIRSDSEPEEAWFVPYFDWFDKSASRENTMADRSNAGALNLGFQRVSHTGVKDPFSWWWKFRKRNNVLPDGARRSCDVESGLDRNK